MVIHDVAVHVDFRGGTVVGLPIIVGASVQKE